MYLHNLLLLKLDFSTFMSPIDATLRCGLVNRMFSTKRRRIIPPRRLDISTWGHVHQKAVRSKVAEERKHHQNYPNNIDTGRVDNPICLLYICGLYNINIYYMNI